MVRAIASLFAVLAAVTLAISASETLEIGRLALIDASEEVPYAYWYYIPESARDGRTLGLVWHATPGGDSPVDPLFWSRFDLRQFLACQPSYAAAPVDLPDEYGFILFSIAVPEPPVSFYSSYPERPLGTPVSLSSLPTFVETDVAAALLDPDLKALQAVEDLRRRLSEAEIPFEPRLFLMGVYRGAEWAHRFSLLHPTEVRAVAPVCGNWYTMPPETTAGWNLPWPLGMADFAMLGRGEFHQTAFSTLPYLVVVSANERVWYVDQTPAQQGASAAALEVYAERFGRIPPERGEAFAREWQSAGYPFTLSWSEGGHGWIDAVRVRVFEFFAKHLSRNAP